ncbi:hypothetical protein Tco_0924703 [Tanacetum coccineum]|uniref:Uncharacterized protein n=1 Tax=Tanacetum coccineum TaxID=301880 RepID=A0ABQ5DBQ6_9ASTR
MLFTDQVDLVNREGHRVVPDMSKPIPLGGPPSQLKAAYYPDFRLEELVLSKWIESVWEYDISAAYDISHWWFKSKEFYITRHSASSNRSAVRSNMRILSVVSLKTYTRYDYTFLREIVLRRADYKENKISKANFKNLHPNDFEDLYLLHLQGKLNHLSGDEKKKMMRESEVHKFSDGMLTRIRDKLDFMVKDYVLFKFNPVVIEKVAVSSKLRSQKPKRTIESRAKRSSIDLVRTLFQFNCLSHTMETRIILRVLRIILVILPEHPSDTKVFTMKMEIMLEPTSNKLLVGSHKDGDGNTLFQQSQVYNRMLILDRNLLRSHESSSKSFKASENSDMNYFRMSKQ